MDSSISTSSSGPTGPRDRPIHRRPGSMRRSWPGPYRAAARSAGVAVPAVRGTGLERATWGQSSTSGCSFLRHRGDATAIAAYVAKYATKTADGTPGLAHPVRSAAQLERLGAPAACRRAGQDRMVARVSEDTGVARPAGARPHLRLPRPVLLQEPEVLHNLHRAPGRPRAASPGASPTPSPTSTPSGALPVGVTTHPEAEDLAVSLDRGFPKGSPSVPGTSPESSHPC